MQVRIFRRRYSSSRNPYAYAARRGIELCHKILKSGCRIETRQLESRAGND